MSTKTVRHTPGPWSLNVALNEDNTFNCVEHERYVISEDNVLIADCYADTALGLDLPESFSKSQANAHLIAAAPELLEVCCILCDSNHDRFTEARNLARTIIAKIEGE